jgi:hypothetical protein
MWVSMWCKILVIAQCIFSKNLFSFLHNNTQNVELSLCTHNYCTLIFHSFVLPSMHSIFFFWKNFTIDTQSRWYEGANVFSRMTGWQAAHEANHKKKFRWMRFTSRKKCRGSLLTFSHSKIFKIYKNKIHLPFYLYFPLFFPTLCAATLLAS